MRFINTSLGAICQVTTGKRPNVKVSNATPDMNIPVYGGNGISWYTNEVLIYPKVPIVLTGRVGTLGTFYQVKQPCWVSDNALIITPQSVDPDFIFYYIKQIKLDNLNRGSTQPLLTQSDLKQIRLTIPDNIQDQIKISNILKLLDSKIEQNTAINNNLEQQAQALFKSWFIDFEPFGGTMPENWTKVSLAECTELVSRGYNTKYVEKSSLFNLNQKANRGNVIEKKHYKYLDENIPVPADRFATKGDVLINSMGVGTIGRTHYWNAEDKNTVVDQCITIIRYKAGVTTGEFLYLLLTSPDYVSYIDQHITGSTGMVSLNISALRDCPIYLPSWNVLHDFHKIVGPLYEKVENNVTENERLELIRDALLPKLMSGEIDVSKVDVSDPSCLNKSSFSCVEG